MRAGHLQTNWPTAIITATIIDCIASRVPFRVGPLKVCKRKRSVEHGKKEEGDNGEENISKEREGQVGH